MTRARRSFLLVFIILLACVECTAEVVEKEPQSIIRVGIFPFAPFNFIDIHGTAQGFNAELIREIVRSENWKVKFIPGSWSEGLERLEKQEIDLMVSVAYSPERAEIMDYNSESVVELWGQVFLRSGEKVHNIDDLSGHRIAVMHKDISGINFIKTAERFDVHCEIVTFSTHKEVFAALQKGEVDAGVAPQHFGLRHVKEYNLVGSSIIFSPFSIFFASKKGTQRELLSHIDAHLVKWKKDVDSFYYQSFNDWLGNPNPRTKNPYWLPYLFFGGAAIVLIFAGFTLLLKRTVKHQTSQLLENEVRLRLALDSASIGEWELDLATNKSRPSSRHDKIFGYSEPVPDWCWLLFLQHVHPSDRDRVEQSFLESILADSEWYEEFRIVRPDKAVRWVWASGHVFKNSSGKQIKVTGMVSDITERKEVEEELKESQERMMLAIASSPIPMMIHDEDNDVLQLSLGWTNMSGYTLKDIPTIADWAYRAYGLEEIGARQAYIDNLFAIDQTIYNGEWLVTAKDGSVRIWDFQTTPLGKVSKGKRVLLSTAIDITDRKQGEEERKNLQSQLIQSQKMEAIGTLAGGIAHDFNNILGVILGYSDMAREATSSSSPVAKDLEQVVKAANRAKELVKKILAFSRLTEAEMVPIQPAVVINETLKLIRSSLPATIVIEQEIDMDSSFILADSTQIDQIVMNLCTNAFHSMEETGGSLSISLANRVFSKQELMSIGDVKPGNFVQISVRDSGSGIAPAIQEKMFDPYFTTKETGKGTGMGLAIIHGIVRNYGGFITCHSQIGEGTVFRIALPAIEKQNVVAANVVEVVSEGNERILFVDDEIMLAEMAAFMLKRLGYSVTVHTSSFDALSAFEKSPDSFDLLITDQTMPGMTGIDLIGRMRKIRPQLPIILCTGYNHFMTKEKASSLGINSFVMKPLTMIEIAAEIRKVLEKEHFEITDVFKKSGGL